MRARSNDVTAILDLPVHCGDVLAGKYEVDLVLGSGGMGMVVRAKHIQLGEMVAIKFLLPDFGTVDRVARFEREARAAAKLKGDHVARVVDLGTLDNGTPYMVMEYLEGEDLDQRLRRRGPLPVAEAVDFMTQACEAMAEAHALGIIHRDLKSSNLFVVNRPDGSERLKVLDFGIAKVVDSDLSGLDADMTRTLAVMGSPTYMSPEQLKSTRNVDARTDVWALGVIVYELLTGRVPFDGEGLPELYASIASGTPKRIGRRDVPEGLEAVVLRCLEKSKEKRFRNVAEVAKALAPFGSKWAMDAAERTLKITQSAKVRLGSTRAESPRGRKMLAAALASAAAVVAFGAVRSCGAISHAGSPPSGASSRSETVEVPVDPGAPFGKSR
jgi:eukaryotic-like serine/threonine-protein kinase